MDVLYVYYFKLVQYLTLYSVNMTYNLKKSIIQRESVCICLCLHPQRGSLSAQCVVLSWQLQKQIVKNRILSNSLLGNKLYYIFNVFFKENITFALEWR